MNPGCIYMMVILLVGSIYDWKYFSLPVWLLLASVLGGAVGTIYSFFGEEASLAGVGMSILPGGSMLLLSYITREQIGYGDGILLLAMGGIFGGRQTMAVLGVALAASFLVSVVLVVLRKAGRTKRLPFVPFLFLGTVITRGGMLFG